MMKDFLNNFVLFICAASLVGAVKFRCDYKKFESGWYKFHEVPTSFNNARYMCAHEGAMLASPTTESMIRLMSGFNASKDIFTGIHTSVASGHFYTMDGTPLADIPHEWADLEPDNKGFKEWCTTLNAAGQLSDVSCNEARPYMCYRKYSNVDVNECGTIDPEYHLSDETKKCYKFHAKAGTFYNANFVCSAEGGRLVVINSETEANVVKRIFAQYPDSKITYKSPGTPNYIFVGFYDYTQNGDWVTIEGQTLEEAGFSSFAKGEPDNWYGKKEACGALSRNGLLSDITCEFNYAFVCEKKPDYPPVC